MMGIETQPWFAALEAEGARRVFSAGDVLAIQDNAPTLVGVIISGKAVAMSCDPEGEQTWIGEFVSGDFFGHMSMLTNLPLSYEMTAQSNMSALIVPIPALKRFMTDNPSVSQAVASDLASRLDLMMRRMVEALTVSAKGRVCAELIRMANPIGIDPGKSVIRPNPVFVELALRVHSTRETVSRTVSDLVKKGILSKQPGALVVNNPESLKDFVR